jgi:oxalate decarboxylase family bicupin protein
VSNCYGYKSRNDTVFPKDRSLISFRLVGAYREMHWHSTDEWAYILNGTFRVALVDSDGKNQVSNVGPGDLWYFASGMPHSIQSTSPGGGEFLLVFDDGSFSEDDTLLLTDFIAHIPREVVVKNFPGLNNSDFDDAPNSELYIFPGTAPAANDSQQVSSPQGTISDSITYALSQQNATQLNGGSIKIVDSSNFPASLNINAAEVVIQVRKAGRHSALSSSTYHLKNSSLEQCESCIGILFRMNGTISSRDMPESQFLQEAPQPAHLISKRVT